MTPYKSSSSVERFPQIGSKQMHMWGLHGTWTSHFQRFKTPTFVVPSTYFFSWGNKLESDEILWNVCYRTYTLQVTTSPTKSKQLFWLVPDVSISRSKMNDKLDHVMHGLLMPGMTVTVIDVLPISGFHWDKLLMLNVRGQDLEKLIQ